MSEQIIDSLKEWFEKEWLYERHLTSELMKDKESFQRGCEYFDLKNYSFEGEIYALLRKEAGLAEVARVNKNLEKYATHCFRQVEKVLSEFILVNPGLEKIGKYLLNDKDFISNPSPNRNLNRTSSKNLFHTIINQHNGRHELNPNCLILKLNGIGKEKGIWSHLRNTKIHLDQKQENRIFKSIMYFDTFGPDQELTENAKKIDKEYKPSLHAFEHMYYLRNINSHLNSKDSYPFKTPQTQDEIEKYRIQPFYKDPMQVMNIELESPGFYQRYVDMVLFLYSEFLKNPHF
jgi:hypothetical protein